MIPSASQSRGPSAPPSPASPPEAARTLNSRPTSKWAISKLVVAKMYADGTLWKTVALLVGTVVALLGLSKLGLWYIAREKERLAAGSWWVEVYRGGFLVDSRPYSQLDVDNAYLLVGLCAPLALFFSIIPVAGVVESVQQAYGKVRQDKIWQSRGQ